MRVRWNRIAALLLGLGAAVIVASNWTPMMDWIAALHQIDSPYASPWERHMGLSTLAVLAVLVVAVVKLLTQSKDRNK